MNVYILCCLFEALKCSLTSGSPLTRLSTIMHGLQKILQQIIFLSIFGELSETLLERSHFTVCSLLLMKIIEQ